MRRLKDVPVNKKLYVVALVFFIALFSALKIHAQELRSVSEPMFVGSECQGTLAEVDATSAVGKRPVLLIHGWDHNRPGVPNPAVWDNLLAYGRSIGWPSQFVKFYTFSYCSNLIPTTKIAQLLSRLVSRMGVENPIIVGHSYGGLIGRSYMQEARLGDTVARLITLATPHCGTPVANGPARNDKLGGNLVYVDWLFDALYWNHVQWFDDNRFDLRSDGCDGLLDYNRPSLAFDVNLWLKALNDRNPYRGKIAAYGGAIAPADSLDNCFLEFDLSCSAFAFDAFLGGSDSDGVVLPVSSTPADCPNFVDCLLVWGYDHSEMATGKSPTDENLFSLVYGNIADFVWTRDRFYFSNWAIPGDLSSVSYHNPRGWGSLNNDHRQLARSQIIGGMATIDVYVDRLGAPMTLTVQAEDTDCDDSFRVYIRQNGVDRFVMERKHISNRGFVISRAIVPAEYLTRNRVTLEFLNTARDSCGQAAIGYIGLE